MPAVVLIFLKGLISAAATSLANIAMKILMKGAAEKELAKLFFFLAAFFAAKTTNEADDKLVKWAKTIYFDEAELETHVATVESAEFIMQSQTEELR